MASRRWNGTLSDMYCPECGLRMTVPRKKGGQRERNHRKKMYCICCKCEQNFIEVREKDFVLENVLA